MTMVNHSFFSCELFGLSQVVGWWCVPGPLSRYFNLCDTLFVTNTHISDLSNLNPPVTSCSWRDNIRHSVRRRVCPLFNTRWRVLLGQDECESGKWNGNSCHTIRTRVPWRPTTTIAITEFVCPMNQSVTIYLCPVHPFWLFGTVFQNKFHNNIKERAMTPITK